MSSQKQGSCLANQKKYNRDGTPPVSTKEVLPFLPQAVGIAVMQSEACLVQTIRRFSLTSPACEVECQLATLIHLLHTATALLKNTFEVYLEKIAASRIAFLLKSRSHPFWRGQLLHTNTKLFNYNFPIAFRYESNRFALISNHLTEVKHSI
jgi:hypothetical protein